MRAGLADGRELGSEDRVLVAVRVDVLEAVADRDGITGPLTIRKREDSSTRRNSAAGWLASSPPIVKKRSDHLIAYLV